MIPSVKCLPRKILNSDSQDTHVNIGPVLHPCDLSSGEAETNGPWPTSIVKQRAPGSVRKRAKENT